MSDDRASRLRERRRSAKSRAERTAEADPEPTPDDEETDADSGATEAGPDDAPDDGDDEDAARTDSVKDEQVGTYMYLPESQKRELQRLFNVMKAEYEYEYDEDFEKNRHFYPLLVRYGLDELDGLDAETVRDRLQDLP